MGIEENIKKYETEGDVSALENIKEEAELSLDGSTAGLAEQAIMRLREIAEKTQEASTTFPSQISQIQSLGGNKEKANELTKDIDLEAENIKKTASEGIEEISKLQKIGEGATEEEDHPAIDKQDKQLLEKAEEELKLIPDMRPFDPEVEKQVVEKFLKQGDESSFSDEEKEVIGKYEDDTRKTLKAARNWFNGDGETSYMIVKELGNPENTIGKAEKKLSEAVERAIENKDKQLIKDNIIPYLIGGSDKFSTGTLKVLLKAYELLADEPIMVSASNIVNMGPATDWRKNYKTYVEKAQEKINAEEEVKQ